MALYKEARTLKSEVVALLGTNRLRKSRIEEQTFSAAFSISANIAEAFGRFGYRDRIQFLYIARGSAWELIDHLHTMSLVEPEKAAQLERLTEGTRSVIRQLNGYIASLRRLAKGGGSGA